jgi:hypothetical protein
MPRPVAGQDAAEFQTARQFVQYTRVARNVYMSALIFGKLRKKTPDWAMDPSFVSHNADFPVWTCRFNIRKMAQLLGSHPT